MDEATKVTTKKMSKTQREAEESKRESSDLLTTLLAKSPSPKFDESVKVMELRTNRRRVEKD
ncbi:hypothetical protein SARC_08910 [Sphaeroforma arctica JP610]|uniref:Uncharacterized protein n=1 Tax=Sphaeroforma arctica JP610 TaxID=667725 RepID=A0A0L0FRT6_9EUKA|nr:hypothetical protein SARC_08910 [Sphaeroforma arctica JP610]KNC78673.1 hypothetical protein SARC_08910 [Sphaeroforma arctica JP610]|eukprot:XP_014152575.1 hypothetical protein SARC_08910 [Sphaeroforma arctica JP610]